MPTNKDKGTHCRNLAYLRQCNNIVVISIRSLEVTLLINHRQGLNAAALHQDILLNSKEGTPISHRY